MGAAHGRVAPARGGGAQFVERSRMTSVHPADSQHVQHDDREVELAEARENHHDRGRALQ